MILCRMATTVTARRAAIALTTRAPPAFATTSGSASIGSNKIYGKSNSNNVLSPPSRSYHFGSSLMMPVKIVEVRYVFCVDLIWFGLVVGTPVL